MDGEIKEKYTFGREKGLNEVTLGHIKREASLGSPVRMRYGESKELCVLLSPHTKHPTRGLTCVFSFKNPRSRYAAAYFTHEETETHRC